MAIAFDVATGSAADLASGANHSHTAGASARAAVVGIVDNGSSSNRVSAVTYGGVAMASTQFNSDTSELGNTQIWILDGIAGGTQNVVVTHTGAIRIAVATVTVTSGQIVTEDTSTGVDTTTATNVSYTMNTTAATNTFGFQVVHSGAQTMTNTPGSGWTLIGSADRSAIGWGGARGTSIFTGGAVTVAWTVGVSEDHCGSSIALKESAPPVTTSLIWETRRNRERRPRQAANPGLFSGR